MQVEMHTRERSTLSDFAEKHGLIMEVHERTPKDMGIRWTADCRYYAHFKNCDIKQGPCLRGTYGDGATPDLAMADYAREISEQRLVINAGSEDRREILAPILMHNA